MILFSVGLPGGLARWCDAVLVQLASRLGGQVACKIWPTPAEMFSFEPVSSTLDAVARFLIVNSAPHLVIGARQPGEELRAALAAQETRFVLTLDDPASAVVDILAETAADPKTVVRAIANCCPLVMLCEGLPGALTLRADRVWADPAAAVSAIAAHLEILVEADAGAAIAAALPAVDAAASSPAAERVSAATRKTIEGALSAYRQGFLGGSPEPIIWTRELFHLAADAGRSPTEPIDVAGGKRILIYGPYIRLPAGSWSAQVILGFSAEAAPYAFAVDVFANGELASTTFQPEAAGVYTAHLTFLLSAPSDKGVEVRVWVVSDDAQGQLALGQVVLQLTRQRPEAAWTPGEFERVLDL